LVQSSGSPGFESRHNCNYKGPNLIPLRVTGRFWVRFFKYFIQFKVSLR